MTNQRGCVVLFISLLWVSSAVARDTAQDIMLRVQRQVSSPVETVRGEMKLYIYGDFHRHYTFVLARNWEAQSATEHVRIDFESPIAVADPESREQGDNRYLLKRVAHKPPVQWMYMRGQQRVRIFPYQPEDRLLQSQLWFYDLTTITNLDDFTYTFTDADTEHADTDHPVIDGTPRAGITPYTAVRFRLERRGDTYLVMSVTYTSERGHREATYSDYQEIASGWFRPRQLVVRDGETERTDITYQEWRLLAVPPDVFSVAKLGTTNLAQSAEGQGDTK